MSRRYFLLWLLLVGLDQATKYGAARGYGRIFRNYLFAFSAPVPAPLMYLAYAIILALIAWYIASYYRSFNATDKLAWTLIAAGSISNIGERVATGYVKDFIYLFSGIFNFADFYILLGIVLLFIAHGRPKRRAS
jgi:lipoprotein signal peptidase